MGLSAAEKGKIARWTQLLTNVQDMSIAKVFPQIPNKRPYNNSSYLKYNLTDVSGFNLPGNVKFIEDINNFERIKYIKLFDTNEEIKYFTICPYSPNDRRNSRDFSESDWDFTIKKLESQKVFGVVLNIGNDFIPEHPLIINLSNKTDFIQSIEIMKKAKGYIGIDSSLSVFAPKLFKTENIIIKSNNQHCYSNKKIYYAPETKCDFIKRKLSF